MSDDVTYGDANRRREANWDREVDPYQSQSQPSHGWGCISWLFILTLVGFMIFLRGAKVEQQEALPPLDDSPASTRGLGELQSRALIGMGELIRRLQPGHEADIRVLFEGDPANPADQAAHQALWRHGTFGQRLQFAITGGELSGPDAALELLGRLKWDWGAAKLNPSAEQLAVFETLRKIYLDYRKKKFDAPSAAEPARQELLKKLGWYGRLALTPPAAPDQVTRNQVMESPLRLVYGILGILGFILLAGIAGIFGLILLGLGTIMGGVKMGIRPGTVSSGIYAETFALWMLGFTVGQLLVALWPRDEDKFLLTLLVFFGSLMVLVWPVIRGIPWQQVRSDIGLTWGRSGIFEPLWGIPGYAMMVPMLGIGVAIMLLAMYLSGGAGGAANPPSPFEAQKMVSHPAVDVVLRGTFWVRFQLILLACVAAPIVEEIMFRGVLYRNMRDWTWRLGWIPSCVFSGLWVSFIFAAIHPQGWIAVPALMGIACGCTLVREWRDSLWASIVVHAINNSLVFSLLMIAAS